VLNTLVVNVLANTTPTEIVFTLIFKIVAFNPITFPEESVFVLKLSKIAIFPKKLFVEIVFVLRDGKVALRPIIIPVEIEFVLRDGKLAVVPVTRELRVSVLNVRAFNDCPGTYGTPLIVFTSIDVVLKENVEISIAKIVLIYNISVLILPSKEKI
jgi:hypothetical protein